MTAGQAAISKPLDTHQKALSINLDARIFGSFAEIGAGQEVARWFLLVGAASGTVAKTISAYDKEVSDDLYGAGTRYVSQPRLQAMLEHEWSQLLSQLDGHRGETTRFFSFVDTVAARNFSGDNECHGWAGLRFQTEPKGVPSDVVLHLNLRDRSNLAQQEAVGVLGVNLIYAATHHLSNAHEFLGHICDGLSLERVEVDCVNLKGPAFEGWDPRAVHALLVAQDLAQCVVFPADGILIPPTDLLYKKAVVLSPGNFSADDAHGQRMAITLAGLPAQEVELSKGSIGLFCLSCEASETGQPPLTVLEILERAADLHKLGSGVVLFRERELYKMGAFVNRFTKSRIHFATELSVLLHVLQDKYRDLEGTLLEGIARLFRENVRINAFSTPAAELADWMARASAKGWNWRESNGLIGAGDIEPPAPLNHLFQYLLGSGFIVPKELSGKLPVEGARDPIEIPDSQQR